jgi:hypothetical protein
LCCEHVSVVVVRPLVLPVHRREEVAVSRSIGLDVHRDFCEVAIAEEGVVRSAGRVETTPERLELFARSLGSEDRVALEVTGGAWEIARILEPHVRRVVVVSPDDTGIRQARAKTDRLDARTLARLLWAGELDAVWMPDERCRAMRRRLAVTGANDAVQRLFTVTGTTTRFRFVTAPEAEPDPVRRDATLDDRRGCEARPLRPRSPRAGLASLTRTRRSSRRSGRA